VVGEIADLLDGDADVAAEIDRVGDVVAVERPVEAPLVGDRGALIEVRILPLPPRGADVVLGTRARHRRVAGVAIEVDLHLALAPPGGEVLLPIHDHADVRAEIAALPRESRKDLEVALQASRILTTPVGMEVERPWGMPVA
jgi:hypothetical protein